MKAMIYVACLAAYNGGSLHGEWIEASSDVDEMSEAVEEMLATSPCAHDHRIDQILARNPRMTEETAVAVARHGALVSARNGRPLSTSTEEWAIHDVENLPGIGEYSSLDEIAASMALLEEHDADLVAALLGHCDSREEAREMLEERYHASAESRDDLAWELLGEVPERLVGYIDLEAVLRDFDCGGGLIIEAGGLVHAFS